MTASDHMKDSPTPSSAMLVAVLVSLVTGTITVLGLDIAADISALADLADGPTPYFVGEHFWRLYVWAPMVAIAASIFVFAPGYFMALAYCRVGDTFADVLMKGFAWALFGVPLAAMPVHFLGLATPLTGVAFVVVLLSLHLLSLGVLMKRSTGGKVNWDVFSGRHLDILVLVLTPLAVLILLSAKFYWESLNGDGGHFLQNARLMIHRGLPFWPAEAGPISLYPSINNVAEVFVSSNFVRLFSEFEFSVRMTFLPGIGILGAVLLAFIRTGWSKSTGAAQAVCVLAALVLYAFVLAFNTSYNPFFADVALPMSREPILVIGLLGFVWFFLKRDYPWITIFALTIFVSGPSGQLLIGFWLIAHFLVTRPLPWTQSIMSGVCVLSVLVIVSLVVELLRSSGVMPDNQEFGISAIVQRLRYVTFLDFHRMLFWILPCGILPALALLAWPWQDRLSRALTLLTIAYVLFFYFQAYRILPHHFAPAMVLPLIVFWRLGPIREKQGRAAVMAAAGIILAGVLSWPESIRPHMFSRSLAMRIAIEPTDRGDFSPARIWATHGLLWAAFPNPRRVSAYGKRFVAEPLSIYSYATRKKSAAQDTTYTIRPASEGTRPGDVRIAGPIDGYVLYTNDEARYQMDRETKDLPRSIAPLYVVSREIIVGRGEQFGDRRVWDIARLIGLDLP
jgi:hypothetical protein